MTIDPIALKDEILTGPLSAEIAPHIGPVPAKPIGPNEIAKILNRVNAAFQIDNFVNAFDIEEAVDPVDWPTAGNEQWKRDLWRDILLSIGSDRPINANATNLKAKILLIFSSGSATRTALAALQTQDASRVIFQFGESVDHRQVSIAMRS